MQSLGEVLTGKLPPVDFRDPDYIERVLVGLQDTAHVERSLTGIVIEQKGHVEGASAWLRLDDLRKGLEAQLERCQQRDTLQAERPAECWCLGLGGKGRRHTVDGESVFSETCDCTEGQAAATRKREIQAAADAKRHADLAARLFGKAGVPSRFAGCTFKSFPVTDRSRASLAAVRDWVTYPPDDASKADWDAWCERSKLSLLLHGPYGVGKTGLAVAILRIKTREEAGLFFTVPDLLDCIRRTYGPNPIANEHEVVESVKNAPFLVLDDLGAERVTEWVREKLFTIINHRHDEDLPTVFTSNLDIAQLGEHIGERTTWRIVEMATVIHVDGPNLRASKGA